MKSFLRKGIILTGSTVFATVSLYIASLYTRHLPDSRTLGTLAVYAFVLFLVNLLVLLLISLSRPKAFVLFMSVTITGLFVVFIFVTDQVTIIEGAGLFLFPAMVFLGSSLLSAVVLFLKKVISGR